MSYSGAGDATAPLTAVDLNLAGDRASTSGCEAGDFAGFTPGNIALIQRGTCTFRIKADNAAAAGAAGAIIFNQGNVVAGDDRLGLFGGTLDLPQAAIPVVSTSYATGAELAGLSGVVMHLAVDAGVSHDRILQPPGGYHGTGRPHGGGGRAPGLGGRGPRHQRQRLRIGRHPGDRAPAGELGIQPTNRIRFAFWGGEEDGLIGSEYYVSQLTARQLKDHAVNLNFDMVGSPNFVRYVYDGDGSAFGEKGPNGSALVEKVFLDYFKSQNLPVVPTAFDGRSDYFGFINNGIPAGGLFTGAEDLKTAEEAAIFGGTAGAPLDPCYHAACDTINNLNLTVLEEMADAIAHTTLTFGMTTSAVNGTTKGNGSGNVDLEYKADKLLK